MSLRLNDTDLLNEVIQRTPSANLALVLNALPTRFLYRLIMALSSLLESTPRWIEFYLIWVKTLFSIHGRFIKKNSHLYATALRHLKKNTQSHYQDLSAV